MDSHVKTSPLQISIHASEKEATTKRLYDLMQKKGFQSTPPRRRRPVCCNWFVCDKRISIHASEKEATLVPCVCFVVCKYFNPRLREGGDINSGICDGFYAVFQSTPPRRRRHPFGDKSTLTVDFNPRLREGGDVLWILLWILWITISIHASEKEATATYCDTSTIMYISSLNNFFVHYF